MKMLLVLACLSLVILGGCITPRVAGFDKQANTVIIETLQGDNQKKAQAEADKYCGSPADLLSLNEQPVGKTVVTPGMIGHSYNVNHNFYTFQCK